MISQRFIKIVEDWKNSGSLDMKDLEKRFEEEEKRLEIYADGANIDGTLVLDTNRDWPNEWKGTNTRQVKVIINEEGCD